MNFPPPRDVFVGQLTREFYLTANDELVLDEPGGSCLYSALGYRIWEDDHVPGMIARVGENYPQKWLNRFQEREIDTRGITILPRSLDARYFSCQGKDGKWSRDNPVRHFARLGKQLPNLLLDYQAEDRSPDSRRKLSERSIRQDDIPPAYQTATGVHLCPVDFLTHNLLPSVFRQAGFTTITLAPCASYMGADFFPDIPGLVTGLTAFLPTAAELRSLFKGKRADLWEMAAELGSFGCSLIVVRREDAGQYLYVTDTDQRWEIPPYPSRKVKVRGVGDAFCGGFFAGYRETFDPLEAVLSGNVAASLVRESLQPFYALDALPGLPGARLEALKKEVKQV